MKVAPAYLHGHTPSRAEILLAGSPSVIALVLYYSLVIHMWVSLGRWPATIGEAGFPPSLVAHASFEKHYFAALCSLGIFSFPVAVVTGWLVPRLQRVLLFAAFAGGFFLISCVQRLAVPPAFLSWWLD